MAYFSRALRGSAIRLEHEYELVLMYSVGFAQPTRSAGAMQCIANSLRRRRWKLNLGRFNVESRLMNSSVENRSRSPILSDEKDC